MEIIWLLFSQKGFSCWTQQTVETDQHDVDTMNSSQTFSSPSMTLIRNYVICFIFWFSLNSDVSEWMILKCSDSTKHLLTRWALPTEPPQQVSSYVIPAIQVCIPGESQQQPLTTHVFQFLITSKHFSFIKIVNRNFKVCFRVSADVSPFKSFPTNLFQVVIVQCLQETWNIFQNYFFAL